MEKLRVGVIGTGRIGKLHVDNLRRHPSVEVASISDLFVDQNWADSMGIEKVTTDYLDIINDPEIDVVFICSSTNTHVPIIRDAAQAGKHIFCEKPISFNNKLTQEALEAVAQAGIKFQTGFNRRFDHNFIRVREAVVTGEIGEPHIIKITSRDPEIPPADYIKNSGGMFIDMCIHDFDMARYLVGSDVVEVYVKGSVMIDPVFAEHGDIDTAIITLTFENGVLGVIDNSRRAAYGYDQRVEVFGSGGSVTAENDLPNTAVVSTAKGIFSDKPKYFFLDRYQDSYVSEVNAFIHSIQNHVPTLVDGIDGLKAELIAHAAKKSLQEGRAVRISEMI